MSTSACENGSQGANFKQVADTFHGLQNRILAQQFDYYILSTYTNHPIRFVKKSGAMS